MLLKVIDKIYLSKEDVKVIFKFELEQSVNFSMFQTEGNHHGFPTLFQVRKRV